MNHEEKEYLISRYNDPDLNEEERKELSALLGEEESRRMQEEYRRLDAMLSKIPSSVEGVDFEAFSNRVRAGISQVSWRTADRRATIFRWVAPLAAAAVFMMAAIPLWYVQRDSETAFPTVSPGVAVVVNPEIPRGMVISQVKVMDLTPQEQGVGSIAVSTVVPLQVTSKEDEGTVMCFVSPEANGQRGNKQTESEAYLGIL